MNVALVPGDWASTAEAEHAVGAAGPGTACTHFAGGRVVVTRSGEDVPPVPVPKAAASTALASVVAAHAGRWGGRAFAFPGAEALRGVLSVAEIVEASAVEAVSEVGRPDDLDGGRLVDTCGFVRPVFRDGRLELLVRPADGGRLVPFEQRHQLACCADHG